ncbi:hypothetical protein MHM582_3054 [Microbacterium sp. HM58-2]|nr:hypothetical protein MHM582_3054 [Microbacterium sp. HM58-2]
MAGNSDEVDGTEPVGEHWFSKPGQEILFYRVNRRPIGGEPSLFHPDPDLLAHLQRVLAPTAAATSGTRYHRTWRLGDLRFNERPESESFTGRLGWARSTETLGQTWDSINHGWIDRVVPKDDSGVAPVAFDARTRVLGILKHPSFTTEPVLAKVLSQILNRGEELQDFPTTEWSVEPLGDVREFYSWLRRVDQLLILRLVFKRPNPDGEKAFDELFKRLDLYEAEQIREEIRARDMARGLNKIAVEQDEQTQGFLTAALKYAFGRVWAKGRRKGKAVSYDQRNKVLRASIDNVGDDWNTAADRVLREVSRRGAKQMAKLENGETS